jgi:hypothetical protein
MGASPAFSDAGKHMCVCEERRLSAHQENKEKEKLEKEPEREIKTSSRTSAAARVHVYLTIYVCVYVKWRVRHGVDGDRPSPLGSAYVSVRGVNELGAVAFPVVVAGISKKN